MHYVITGGAGFIGSHLVERLLADGHTVTVLDDLSTGKRENLPAAAKLIVGDIITPGVFDALVEEADGFFHLAAVVSVPKSVEAWLPTHRVNLGGMVALLDAIARKGKKTPVVFASSAAVYGNSADVPLKEIARCAPLSAYGADKLGCELHAGVAAHIHKIPTIGLRFFNVYGPRQDPASPYSGVISIFAGRMKQHQPVTIFGDGEQSRDFIFVGDIVDGLVLAMQKLTAKQLTYGIFNLCTGVQTTVNALAKMIASLTPAQSAITHGPLRAGDVRISLGDTQHAKKMLGFGARTPLNEGLTKTLGVL